MEWIRIFGIILILLYLICGLDDTIWSLCAIITGLLHPQRNKDDTLSFAEMRNTPPKLLAVSIAAWHESNVIEDVITNFLNTTDYPQSMYHLFVGVYPNDPETIAAVTAVSKNYSNVHAVINCMNGPTTKAQNINHVIRQIKVYEQENHVRFASLTVHDSEDVIHTYELLATNYLIDRHDALQFPVFPIIKMPTFRNFFSQMTTATYADEFAENHYITLILRRNMQAFVPCAGTGFALSRKCFEQNDDILPSESLTEDYLLSLMLYKKGIPLHYVLDQLQRVGKNGKIRTDFITTRSLFPFTFRAAVRQKTRWTYGITMQSVSLKDVFESKGVSIAGRYSFYKDLKGKVVNLLPLLGYIASLYGIAALIFNLEPLYTYGSPVYYMALAVLAMTIIRQVFRGYSLYHVYGIRSVFFGCLVPPLFPIRLVYGNIINFTATFRALLMKIRGDRKAKIEREKSRKTNKPPKKRMMKWAKTDHSFLSKEQLRAYRRMLGDTLIVQGNITPQQFNNALNHVDKEHGQHIGEYLIQRKMITEEQLIQALSHVNHILFVPDEVARRLEYKRALKEYDIQRLQELKILPLTTENDIRIIGICNDTTEDSIRAFQEEYQCRTKQMYLTSSFLQNALQPTEQNTKTRRHLQSLSVYHDGLISYEQAILIGIYSYILQRSEDQIRRGMGLLLPYEDKAKIHRTKKSSKRRH